MPDDLPSVGGKLQESDAGNAASPAPILRTSLAPRAKPKKSFAARAWRYAIIEWHGFVAWVRQAGLASRAFAAIASLGLLGYPLFKAGWKHGTVWTLFWIGLGLYKAWRELNPRNMQMLQRNYLERKLAFYKHLVDYLQPYVCLLAWTLDQRMDKVDVSTTRSDDARG